MQNNDLPKIDFNPINNKKKFLFFKRPKGTPIPVGILWKCLCANENMLTEADEQYCSKCGARLRLQENKEDNSIYFTTVIVSHIIPGRK
jgi:uncharacterized protein (DUF983 family)